MSSWFMLCLVLSACTAVGCSPRDSTPPATGDPPPAIGRVVTELDSRIWCIHQDRGGDYWFGSNGAGVFRYDGEEVTHYTRADGLCGNHVRDIDEDLEGNVFIATTDGVARFDGKAFTPLELVEASPAGEGWAIGPDDVWLVVDPDRYGPCRYDGERLYHLPLPKSPVEDAMRARYPGTPFSLAGVYSVYEDRRGHLWFGTLAVGLCRFDGRDLSWMYEERLVETPDGGMFGMRSIYQDRAGDYWICNTRQRFVIAPEATRKDGFSLLEYESKEGLPDAQSDKGRNFAYFPSMTEDEAGALWMACGSDGVWKHDGQGVTRFPVGDGAYTFCIYRDHDGQLWAGTGEQGLHVLDGERFVPFTPGG